MAALPLRRNEVSPQGRVQVNQDAVKVWNCCCTVDRDGLDDSTKMKIAQAISRAFHTGCCAIRDCMSCGLLKPAVQIVTSLADLQHKLHDADPNPTSPTSRAHFLRLHALLRTPSAKRLQGPSIRKRTLDNLHGKVTDTLPFVFEALLFISEAQDGEKGSFDQVNLLAIIDKASKLEAGPKGYASFADTLLSSFLSQEREDYNTDQAGRWIPCVVQIVLDYRDGDEPLSLVRIAVDQALALAWDATGEVNGMAADQDQKAAARQIVPGRGTALGQQRTIQSWH
ncbi:hypothetical protein DV736_g1782, partial [Chaetothyriales sp. CBS 134916]